MMHDELSAKDKQRIRKSLLEYCGQDTFAMVELLRKLERQVSKKKVGGTHGS